MNGRKTLIGSALLGALFLSTVLGSDARAVEFSILGPTTIVAIPGEIVTIDVALTNHDGATVQGLTGVLSGIDPGVLSLRSGETALHHFTQFCAPTNCFGGIDASSAYINPFDLTANYSGGSTLTVVHANALNPTTSTGANDPGLDGAFDVASARDITISFLMTGVGERVLTFGGEYWDGENVLPITQTASVLVTVPEPGAVILLGLGMAGLATASRDRRYPSRRS